MSGVVTMARADGLMNYDATDLELALHRGLPLLTKDHKSAEAANRRSVVVLPLQTKAEVPPPTRSRRRKT